MIKKRIQFAVASSLAFLFLFLFVGCDREKSLPAQEPVKNQEMEAEKSQEPRIHAIPTFSVSAVLVPEAWPFPPQGLTFQMGEFNMANAQRHRPIGTGGLGPHHEVVLSFPDKDQVIVFDPPSWDLVAYGSERTGGNGAPLKAPNRFRLFDDSLVVTSKRHGLVHHLDLDGSLIKSVDLGATRDVAIGPDGYILESRTTGAHLLVRRDPDGKPVKHYGFGPQTMRVRPPGNDAFSGFFQIRDNWDVIFMNRPATVLYHFDKKGLVQRQFDLRLRTAFDPQDADTQWSKHLKVNGVRYVTKVYWVLLSQTPPEQEQQSLMITLDDEGALRSCWHLPFQADGFDIDDRLVLLYEKAAGSAQTYRLW